MIKVQNIYHMLAYAFQVLREDRYAKLATEDFENVSDLLAAILSKGISNQIRRGLGREYIETKASVSSPVGKIDISSSLKQLSFTEKCLVCEYDQFTENAYLNQILKTTATLLLQSKEVRPKRKKDLISVLRYMANVNLVDLRRVNWNRINYHRNNATYKMLMNLCYLVISGLLLTKHGGNAKLANYLDDQKMHRLFERFIMEYYRKHFPLLHVSAAQINWDVDDGVLEYLPVMQSDITLKYGNDTVIIDTKYYSSTMQYNKMYDSRTIHSANLYQIYTYVKNSAGKSIGDVSGVLLYAKTDEEITPDNEYRISGNHFSVKTIDLNTDFHCIAEQLNKLVDQHFGAVERV